ncbi:MAG TPA: hypothetical protein VGD01_09055 [Candidatus Elarobacter sp.]|jgi:hypothetical protein
MYGTGTPFAPRPGRGRWTRLALVVVGIAVLAIFIIDKLVEPPVREVPPSEVLAHLERRDVRRVTIPAATVTLELNDGRRLTVPVPSDRDLWPSIRTSGADVAIAARGSEAPRGLTAYLSAAVGLVVVTLLAVTIFRTARRIAR